MQIIDIHMSIKGAIDDAIARAAAIGGLLAVALIHMLQLPNAFDKIGYLGALFIAAIVASLLLATVLTRTSDDRAWAAAGGVAMLILLCYIVSRSVGLPGFTSDIGEWSERSGLASMVAEGLLAMLSTAVLVTRRYPLGDAASRSAPGRVAGGASVDPAIG